ncbi:hypothetical protein HanPI659440_Chr10g0364201 [Helianthus annuus]|nr:hypothetical protein HanPI659440_Chr10g0364201 [Helianthus annuus]
MFLIIEFGGCCVGVLGDMEKCLGNNTSLGKLWWNGGRVSRWRMGLRQLQRRIGILMIN